MIVNGNSLYLPFSDCAFHACVTSPPYFQLRDYGDDRQIGSETDIDSYVQSVVRAFREVRRVLRSDGLLFLNLGDSYAGSGKGAWGTRESADKKGAATKEKYVPLRSEIPMAGKVPYGLKRKDLMGIPWRVALALQSDGAADYRASNVLEGAIERLRDEYGPEDIPARVAAVIADMQKDCNQARDGAWWLRQEIIWHKSNAKPENVRDRCTRAHEHIFMLSKSPSYRYFDDAVAEPSGVPSIRYGGMLRNRRSVWSINVTPGESLGHSAVYPKELVRICLMASTVHGDTVIDPFSGSGTTLRVASEMGRRAFGVELNIDYIEKISAISH